MNIYLLLADGQIIFACPNEDLFNQTTEQLQALLAEKPDNYLPRMGWICQHHFASAPNELTVQTVRQLFFPISLSSREFQVAEEITKGTRPKEIATVLKISVKSVSTYRARIMKKFGCKTTVDIALRMRDHGLA